MIVIYIVDMFNNDMIFLALWSRSCKAVPIRLLWPDHVAKLQRRKQS